VAVAESAPQANTRCVCVIRTTVGIGGGVGGRRHVTGPNEEVGGTSTLTSVDRSKA